MRLRYASPLVVVIGALLLLLAGTPSVSGQQPAKAPADTASSETANPEVANPETATGEAASAEVIPADWKPFWDSAQAFVNSYANRDATAIGEMFTEDAELLDEFGELTEGRAAITDLFASVFEADEGAMIDEIQITRVRYISDSVALEEGFVQSSEVPGETGHRSRYVALHTKQADGKWLINTLKDFPREAVGRQQQLSQLAWMVGEWVNEDDESVVHTVCDWSPDGNYLLRHFTKQLRDGSELSGVQRVGWDPTRNKLRSWTFDSGGGFFQGLWTREGNRWLLNLAGVTSEGESVTATSVYTLVDAEMVIWQSQNLVVGEEFRGDSEPITMVKRPPVPVQAAN